MSFLQKDKLFMGLFSIAGIESAEKYKIFEEFKKTKYRDRDDNHVYQDSFLPDKKWQESLIKKEIINPNDIIKGCKFNINELKSEIKKQNLYFKGEFPQKTKKIKKKINKIQINKNSNIKKKKIPIINRKYKYHNLHMKRIEKYRKEGIYDKILNQVESVYYPKLDCVYRKIESGPKWEKLSGRGILFETEMKKYNSINIYSYNSHKEKEKDKNKEKEKNRNRSLYNIMPSLYKSRNNKLNIKNKLDSVKNSNIMTKSSSTYSKLNVFNKHNNYIHSISDLNYNNSSILTQKKDKSMAHKQLILDNPDRTTYNMKKCKSVLNFGKYLDYEKIEKKIKKNQKINRIQNILNPNYSSIEGNVKMFVKYNNNKNKGGKKEKGIKNKIINFEGINTNELLYDANYTFEKIYGNRLRAVPLFHKMARPNDINLPSYMKGLYSRIGLYLTNEKTLQMNNYENAKMYKFDGDFTPKKSKNIYLRKIYFDEEDNDKSKIEKDLELMQRKFRNIQFKIYD